MKKIILIFLFVAVLISPISASAMNRNQIEEQYRQTIIQVIELLMQKVEALILELEGMQSESIPTRTFLVEEEVEEEPIKWVRPFDGYNPATPNDPCHAPGQLDVKINCK